MIGSKTALRRPFRLFPLGENGGALLGVALPLALCTALICHFAQISNYFNFDLVATDLSKAQPMR